MMRFRIAPIPLTLALASSVAGMPVAVRPALDVAGRVTPQ
jgi:hypothetical protein